MNVNSVCQNAHSLSSRLPFTARKSSKFAMPLLALLALLCGMTASLHAQSAFYNGGTMSTISSSFAGPMGVTTDANGNVFVADNNPSPTNTGTMYEIPYGSTTPTALPGPTGGFLCPATVSESTPCLRDVAVDSNGYLWVAAFGGSPTPAGQVYVYSAGLSAAPVAVGTWANPWGITADSAGNVYVTDNSANTITKIANGATVTPTLTVVYTYAAGGVQNPRGIAIDPSGDLFVIDGNAGQLKELPGPGPTYSTVNTVSGGLQGPGDLARDTSGNIWVSEYSAGAVAEFADWNATTTSFATILGWGSGLSGPVSVWPDSKTGDILVSDNGNSAVKQIALQPATFGSVADGNTSSQTLTFTVFGTTTVLNPPVLVTEGAAAGSDLAAPGGWSCTAAYGNDLCTVTVNFTPKAPGLRRGAVELEDNLGNLLATATVFGVGTGPELVFSPSAATISFTGMGTPHQPEKIAIDGSGNVYIADANNGQIFKIAAGTTAAASLATGLSTPYGIAVDGAGNLFVTNAGGGTPGVVELTAASNYATILTLAPTHTFSGPLGLAFDASGNLYVADANAANQILELTWGSGYANVIQVTPAAPANIFGKPFDVAVDPNSGNLWVADYGASPINPSVTELSTAGTVIHTFSAVSNPESVAIDPAGDVYFADDTGGTITELTATSSYATAVTLASATSTPAVSDPAGVAVDSLGNVYYTNDTTDEAYELNLASPPASISFASTPYLTQNTVSTPPSVTVSNIGNASLTFTSVSATAPSFATGTASGDCVAGSVSSGTSCDLTVTFTPHTVGTITGTATLTDNAATSPQTISLTGIGAAATATVVAANATATYNPAAQNVTLTATVTATGVADINEGTVAFTVVGTTTGAVTSPTVVNGAATVTYPIPAGQAAGPYTIQAVYTDAGGGFSTSTDSTHTLTIGLDAQATLTVNVITPATYNTTQTLTTTGGSDNGAVTYSVGGSTACSVTGAVLTITSGTGTCSVIATMAGNADYSPVSSAAAMVTVQLAAQTPALVAHATSPAPYNSTQTLTTTGGIGTGAVTFSGGLSTACSVTGTTLTITSGTGTCVITATKAADSDYSAYTSAAVTVTVQMINQGTLTLNAISPATYNTTQTLTTTGGNGTGAVTYSATGSTACSVTGATLTITSGTGTCSLTATKAADANYNAASATATVTVQKAAQGTLTAVVTSPAAYTSTQTLTTTGGSGTGAVTYSVGASTACSVTGATLTITAGTGTCSVIATKAADNNYNAVSSTAATVVVATASLTVSANSATRVYGAANPTFTGTVTGEKNGDTFTESFSTTATITSNVGTYPIVPSASGTNLGDYAVTDVDGTLTITKANSTTSLSAGGSTASPGATVTLTATVASATSGTPTGTVTFYDGTTMLGTGTLTGGVATYSTTTLAAGASNTLTAVYGGDANFNGSTSSSTSITIGVLDFTLGTPNPATQTGAAGTAFTYAFSITPTYGTYAGTVNFTATGLPSGATATFSPSSIPANGGAQNVTMIVSTAAGSAALVRPNTGGRGLIPVALAFLLLPFAGTKRMRREGRRLGRLGCMFLLVLAGLGATAALTGCGSHAAVGGNSSQSYTVTITAASGSIQHTTTVTLDLQQ
ncbi:MAG: Ig-like domain repeat protein [Acidobacteriaceae bacterium]